jgi:hypothetical protein
VVEPVDRRPVAADGLDAGLQPGGVFVQDGPRQALSLNWVIMLDGADLHVFAVLPNAHDVAAVRLALED